MSLISLCLRIKIPHLPSSQGRDTAQMIERAKDAHSWLGDTRIRKQHACMSSMYKYCTALCSSEKQLQEEDQLSFSSSGILRQEWSAGRGCATSLLNGKDERRLGGERKRLCKTLGCGLGLTWALSLFLLRR